MATIIKLTIFPLLKQNFYKPKYNKLSLHSVENKGWAGKRHLAGIQSVIKFQQREAENILRITCASKCYLS